MTAFIANTNVIELIGLKSTIEDEFINDATVTVTVKLAGEEIEGETWPLAMSYVAASDGNYRALLDHELPLTHATHVAFIEVDAGGERFGHWELKFKPAARTVT